MMFSQTYQLIIGAGNKSDLRTCSSRETVIPIYKTQILVFIHLPTDLEFIFWKSNDIM